MGDDPLAEDDGDAVDSPRSTVDSDVDAPTDMSTPPAPEPRRRGRKPGMPRVPGSGRKKGGPSWTSAELRNKILNASGCVEVLIKVARGESLLVADSMVTAKDVGAGRGVWRRPSLAQRIDAAQYLLNKILPSMQATELTGKDGAPLIPKPEADMTNPEERASLARILVALLQSGAPASTPGDGAVVVNGTSTRSPTLDARDQLGD